MSIRLKQKSRPHKPLRFQEGMNATEARYRAFPSGEASVALPDANAIITTCVRCLVPHCIERQPITPISEFGGLFPSDQNRYVCPVDAIHWPLESSTPLVNEDKCISCGVCIAACPVSAIYYSEGNAPRVSENASQYLVESEFTDAPVEYDINKSGQMFPDLISLLQSVYSQIPKKKRYGGANFPNILTRNLLSSLGVNAMTRRQGDTNIRMDMLLDGTNYIGVAEVEFGNDVLNSPRNLLDNIAVLSSRYEIDKTSIMPVVFTLSLPNFRSQYWHVISDIRSVTGLRISTITIGALVILLSENVPFALQDIAAFYIDCDECSLRPAIQGLINKEIEIQEGFFGILEPQK